MKAPRPDFHGDDQLRLVQSARALALIMGTRSTDSVVTTMA